MDSYIQSVIDGLDTTPPKNRYRYCIKLLMWQLSLVRTNYAFGRKWGKGESCESAMRSLEETVYRHSLEIWCLCLTLEDVNDKEELINKDRNSLYWKVVDQFCEGIINSIGRGMQELRQSLYDDAILQRWSSFPVEMEELLGMLDSLIRDLGYMRQERIKDLPESFGFLKDLIRFVIFRGVDHKYMRDMSIHVQCLVVDVASSILTSPYFLTEEIDGLIETIKPVEFQVCEIYVRVLEEASRTSKSSDHATPESCTIMLHMVDSIIFLLSELLLHRFTYAFMFENQMNSVFEGLIFLRTSLRVHHDKLDEKMYNFFGVLICEASMMVCYLYVRMDNARLVESLQDLFNSFDKKMKHIQEIEEETQRSPVHMTSFFPQTNLSGFFDSILEKLESFNLDKANQVVIAEEKRFQIIWGDLVFLRSFLADFFGQPDQNDKVQALLSSVATIIYEVEYVFDSLASGGAIENFVGIINTIIEKMKVVKIETSEVSQSVEQITKVANIAKTHMKMPLAANDQGYNEPVVGLDDEAQKIIDRLRKGTKRRDVISIVGMAGLGKTTLAKKIYHDLSIVHHFHIRAWCTISQVYNKRSLLQEIFSVLDIGNNKKCSYMSEDDLADAIRRHLKRKRYLLILDDIWDVEAWDNLEISFPNDAEGSRVLLTSRNENVALQIAPESEPFCLRLLTEEESWELFRIRISFGEGCLPELLSRGKAIAQCCKGLPLMIIVVVGLLSSVETSRWDEVEDSLMKSKSSILEQCKETLELSYQHLPEYLKSCFLYFGAYKEDQRICVQELLRLWIAEGFVEISAGGCVEDVVECYLRELIQRNLVMIAKRGSRGEVKFCILHDLLHEFCIGKSTEDQFLNRLRARDLGSFSKPNLSYRLHLHSRKHEYFAEPRFDFPYLRTLFIYDDKKTEDARPWYDIMYRFSRSKLLRVLDLRNFGPIHFFPGVIPLLGHLKYLALKVEGDNFILPPSIASLLNLETLILSGYTYRVLLPNTLWKMKNLRCLHTTSVWGLPTDDPEHISVLENLQSFSKVELSVGPRIKKVIQRFPNIRRFKCQLDFKESPLIIALDFLIHLESLTISGWGSTKMCNDHFQFPHNLKKLTLRGVGLPWSKISTVDRLPNLEVLRLKWKSFFGDNWMMKGEGAFPKLRFLELEKLDLTRWTDSDYNCPSLQKLVLRQCPNLEELPSFLAEISTIQMIEVCECKNVTHSIKQIQETQMDFGNVDLKIIYTRD